MGSAPVALIPSGLTPYKLYYHMPLLIISIVGMITLPLMVIAVPMQLMHPFIALVGLVASMLYFAVAFFTNLIGIARKQYLLCHAVLLALQGVLGLLLLAVFVCAS